MLSTLVITSLIGSFLFFIFIVYMTSSYILEIRTKIQIWLYEPIYIKLALNLFIGLYLFLCLLAILYEIYGNIPADLWKSGICYATSNANFEDSLEANFTAIAEDKVEITRLTNQYIGLEARIESYEDTIDGLTKEKAEAEQAASQSDTSEANKAQVLAKELEVQISEAKKDLASLHEDFANVQAKIDAIEDKLGI